MTTNRPLIAVTPLMDYGRDSLWMLPGYMEAIMRAGGTPVMLPLTDDTDILRNAPNGLTRFCLRAGRMWDRWLVQRPPPPAVARCSLLSATEWNRFCCQL